MSEFFSIPLETWGTFLEMADVMKSLRYLGPPDSSAILGRRGAIDSDFLRPDWDLVRLFVDCHYGDEGLGDASERPSEEQLSKLKLPSYVQLLSAYLKLREKYLESKGFSEDEGNSKQKIAEKLYEIDLMIAGQLSFDPKEYYRKKLLNDLEQTKNNKNYRSNKSGEQRIWAKSKIIKLIRDWTTKIGLKDGYVIVEEKKNEDGKKILRLERGHENSIPQIHDAILTRLNKEIFKILEEEEFQKQKIAEEEHLAPEGTDALDLGQRIYLIELFVTKKPKPNETLSASFIKEHYRILGFWVLMTQEPKPPKYRLENRHPLRGAYIYYAREINNIHTIITSEASLGDFQKDDEGNYQLVSSENSLKENHEFEIPQDLEYEVEEVGPPLGILYNGEV